MAFASSLDCIGPFAHSVEDVAHLLGGMAGVDPWDATSAPVSVPDYTEALSGSVQGVRIGLPREYYAEGLDEDIRRMLEAQVDHLRQAGAEIKTVEMPHTEYGIAYSLDSTLLVTNPTGNLPELPHSSYEKEGLALALARLPREYHRLTSDKLSGTQYLVRECVENAAIGYLNVEDDRLQVVSEETDSS